MIDPEKVGDPKMNELKVSQIDELDLSTPEVSPEVLTLPERIINCPLTELLQRLSSKKDLKE